MDSRLESAWKTLDTINEWTRFADTKAGAVLGVVGVVAGILLSVLSEAGGSLYRQHPLLFSLLVLGIISGCGAIYHAVRCLNPTLHVGESNSLIYFAHVAQRFEAPISYRQAVDREFATDEQMLSQITL
jgi:hypothetical protein